jgi:type II secretion system protein H
VKDKGFSLIEVMVVLILMGLSMVLVTPSLSRFSKAAELKGAAKKISAILRYYRSEAVNQGRVYQVLFDPDLREVWVQRIEEKEEDEAANPVRNSNPAAEQQGINSNGAKDKSSSKRYTLPKGVDIKEVKADSPQYPSDYSVIEFYPNGGSNGGTIFLKSQDRKGYRIKVYFLTGMVEIEKV